MGPDFAPPDESPARDFRSPTRAPSRSRLAELTAPADAIELCGDAAAGEDRRGDLGQQRGFALARGRVPSSAPGLRGTLTEERRQTSDYYGGNQQQAELDHVAGVRDAQLVAQGDEQVVEDQHAQHRRGQRCDLAMADGNRQYGKEVDDAETGRRRRRLERC
jgi:hypothetical protein